MQITTNFLDMILFKGKPAVVWFQQKKVCWIYHSFLHTILLRCSSKNAIMKQLHDHCLITFWTRPWVLNTFATGRHIYTFYLIKGSRRHTGGHPRGLCGCHDRPLCTTGTQP